MSNDKIQGDVFSILSLNEGEEYMFHKFCEGGALVKKVDGIYELYEVACYCGTPMFDRHFDITQVEEIVTMVYQYWN